MRLKQSSVVMMCRIIPCRGCELFPNNKHSFDVMANYYFSPQLGVSYISPQSATCKAMSTALKNK
jgi:hypothetical protein